MAATACAYGYQGARPAQVLLPDTFIDVDGAVRQAEPPPRPSSKVPSSFLSHHLDICTEGLGSESSGDIDITDLTDEFKDDNHVDVDVGQALPPCKRQHHRDRDGGDEEPRRARSARPAFPPPISLIGAGGKPWLYLRPQREDGRLVLREVRIPSCELLQARREDGRFKLQFAQPQPDECQQEAQGQDPADAMAPEKTDGRFKLQFAQPQPDECQQEAQGQDPADAMAPEKTQQRNEKE